MTDTVLPNPALPVNPNAGIRSFVRRTAPRSLLLAVVGVWRSLDTSRPFRAGFWVWQGGLALTTAGMLAKGVLQVLGDDAADSAALAGISGLGHVALTVAFVLLFVGLGRVVTRTDADRRLPRVANATAPARVES